MSSCRATNANGYALRLLLGEIKIHDVPAAVRKEWEESRIAAYAAKKQADEARYVKPPVRRYCGRHFE